MSAPISGTRNFHMIEAVPERFEGAPRQFRRRWSDDFKERAVAEAMEPERMSRQLRVASAYIHHSYSAGVVMLAPNKGLFGACGY